MNIQVPDPSCQYELQCIVKTMSQRADKTLICLLDNHGAVPGRG